MAAVCSKPRQTAKLTAVCKGLSGHIPGDDQPGMVTADHGVLPGPHAKTVLSSIKEPEKKRKLDTEKMSKLLKLIRGETPETGGGDMNENAKGIFLQRQEVLDIFICPQSRLKAKPCQHSMKTSGDAGTGPGTVESTQTQDLFKRIRKYPVATFLHFPRHLRLR